MVATLLFDFITWTIGANDYDGKAGKIYVKVMEHNFFHNIFLTRTL